MNLFSQISKNGRIAAPIAVIVAMAYSLVQSWSSMCLGESGTRYFMTGETGNPLAYSCAAYDYSRFYPGFESKTDSLRMFR